MTPDAVQDAEISYLKTRLTEDREESLRISERLRVVELAVASVSREVKIWGVILSALITSVLVTVISKLR